MPGPITGGGGGGGGTFPATTNLIAGTAVANVGADSGVLFTSGNNPNGDIVCLVTDGGGNKSFCVVGATGSQLLSTLGVNDVNGIVKCDGLGTFSPAAAGTDYLAPNGDGSALSGVVTTGSFNITFAPVVDGTPGLLKITGSNTTGLASAGTDYLAPGGDISGTTGTNSTIDSLVSDLTATIPIAGSFSGVGTATTTFTVTIGSTRPDANYKVNATPSNVLSAAVFFVNNKTTTTFDVVYVAGLTGTVQFDWILAP